ncbi:ribonuclease H-like domain-containing protein [Tanacetum coccineum]
MTRGVLLRCDNTGDLYPVTAPSPIPHAFLISQHTWHQRLGHPGSDVLCRLVTNNVISCNKEKPLVLCHACQLGKHVRLPFVSSKTIISSCFDIVHLDVWTSPIPSLLCFQYHVLFLDHYSQFVWVYPLVRKSDVLSKFILFRNYVRTQFKCEIRAFQCDHGGEFDNRNLHDLFNTHGIQFRFSCPKTSQQNGKSERMVRTLNKIIRTLLFQAKLPPTYWVEALHMAVHILNILPSTAINNEVPFTHLFGTSPDYSLLLTRFRVRTNRPVEHLTLYVSSVSPVPRSYHKAFNDANWHSAMRDEYNALIKNSTWTLVPRPPDANVVQCMWLFCHKYLADGTLSRYKARLVANGSTQLEGVDVDETFSPIVKPGTIRTVLSLATSRHWPVHQLDVKNAFLHGDLSKTVYMYQPPGFWDSTHPDYVCLLQHSLYELKQAPRAWFQRFASYITRVGFHQSRCDSSLFIFHQGKDTAYLLLYVDDIVLTASSSYLLHRIISSLHQEFAMTDLGSLNYFLGISVTRDSSRMFLSQKKYAVEILEHVGIVNCNPSRTPVDTESKLGSTGDVVSDPTLYRSLAGSLKYLTFTRPDISYVVQQLFSSSTTDLVAYSDADWTGYPTTRRTEAKHRGAANVVAKTCWLRNLLRELHTPLSSVMLVYCDNVSVVYLSFNPVQHQRTKHTEIDIHFIHDLVSTALFEEFRSSLSVRCPPAQTAGEC